VCVPAVPGGLAVRWLNITKIKKIKINLLESFGPGTNSFVSEALVSFLAHEGGKGHMQPLTSRVFSTACFYAWIPKLACQLCCWQWVHDALSLGALSRSVKKTTSQNLWPRIHSNEFKNALMNTARSTVFKKPRVARFGLLRRKPQDFEIVTLVAHWRKHFWVFLAIFWLLNSLQKKFFRTQEFTRFLSTV